MKKWPISVVACCYGESVAWAESLLKQKKAPAYAGAFYLFIF